METKIEKLIKIGKWTLGVGAVLNIMVWAILGMLAYKYIYLDHFDSKYKNYIARDTFWNTYHTLSMIESLDELYKKYHSSLIKDEIKDLKSGNRCTDFSLDLINLFIENREETINKYLNTDNFKVVEDNFLNYTVGKGNFEESFNCKNVKYTIFAKLISGNQSEIGRIRIDIDDLDFNEDINTKLHRVDRKGKGYYKIIDKTDSVISYIDTWNNTFVKMNKNGSIDIIYPEYTKRMLAIADKYYGSREETLEHPSFWAKNGLEKYKGFDFLAFFLEETKKVPSNAKGILMQRHEDIIKENSRSFITDEMNKRLDFMGIKHN